MLTRGGELEEENSADGSNFGETGRLMMPKMTLTFLETKIGSMMMIRIKIITTRARMIPPVETTPVAMMKVSLTMPVEMTRHAMMKVSLTMPKALGSTRIGVTKTTKSSIPI